MGQQNWENGIYILDEPDADILSFDDGAIHRIEYEDTESYKVMEMFINRRKQVLDNLLW